MANKILLTFIIALCAIITVHSVPTGISKKVEQFSNNARLFSMDLYSQVRESEQGNNLIFSPFSIQTCVALAYIGAGGKTATEIAKGLRLQENNRKVVGESFQNVLDTYTTGGDASLKIANKFYVKTGYEVQDEFNQIATKNFHSEAENINFEDKENAVGVMNKWVEKKTNDKIKDLISKDDINEDTRMVLINAIHFKGEWSHKFPFTNKEDFWMSETDSVKVDMMIKGEGRFNYGIFEELDATAIEMPYKSDFSMFVLLPNSRMGLSALEEKIRNLDLGDLTKRMRIENVNVHFPKFKNELQLELGPTLREMGMSEMFTDFANFSGLLKSNYPLKVSKVIHKAFIEVHEDGTEAAAATAVIVPVFLSSFRYAGPTYDFNANHPFFYAIVDTQANLPVFMGSVNKF